MHRGLIALLLVLAAAPRAWAVDALGAIDACIRQLDAGLDVGYQRIAARCPDLGPALATSPWAVWLPPDWSRSGNELSAGGLAELRTLLARNLTGVAGERPLNVGHLGPLLAELGRGEPPRGGWWARFKDWLHGLFGPRPQPTDPGWLRRLFGDVSLSQALREAIVWGALATLIGLAGAIVVNELRIAGLLRPLRQRSTGAREAGAAATGNLTLQDVDRAGVLQQPRLLLELIVTRLAEQERLPATRALTVRELVRAARLPDAADCVRLQALGAACERVRFSDREIPTAALAAALTQGRELLAALAPPAQQPRVA